jgi:hypothetical protein
VGTSSGCSHVLLQLRDPCEWNIKLPKLRFAIAFIVHDWGTAYAEEGEGGDNLHMSIVEFPVSGWVWLSHSDCWVRLLEYVAALSTSLRIGNGAWPLLDNTLLQGSRVSKIYWVKLWTFQSLCEPCSSHFLSFQVKVKFEVTLLLTVSQSVCLGVEPNLGLLTRDFFFKVTLLSFLGRPLCERSGLSCVSFCHWSLQESVIIYNYLHLN